MRRSRVAPVLVAAAVAAAASIQACSDGDERASSHPPTDAGAMRESAAITRPDDRDDAGPLLRLELPDTACEAAAGTTRALFTGADELTTPTALAIAGARRGALIGGGIATFDADGASASAIAGAPSYATLTSTGSTLIAFGIVEERLTAIRFAPSGAPVGEAVVISAERPSGYSAGSGPGFALVAWATGSGSVYARSIGVDVTLLGAPFFVRALGETEDVRASIAGGGGSELAIALSGGYGGVANRVAFARVSATGLVERSHTLETGPELVRVVQLAKTSTGYALLTQRAGGAHLLMLDAHGAPRGGLLKLGGSIHAFGVAAHGDDVAILATKRSPSPIRDAGADAAALDSALDTGVDADGAAEPTDSGADAAAPPTSADTSLALRVVDRDGAALGGWRCLGGDHAVDFETGGALVDDGDGWAVLHRQADRSVVLSRVPR